VAFYSAVFPFVAFAPDFFYHKFGISLLESGKITSLLPLGTMLFTPLFGFLVDRKGRSATAMIIGALTLLFVHLVFALTSLQPHFFLILLGVAFSLVPAAMWPSMVKLVKEKEIGTAYGLMYSIQNLGLWGVPILAGMVLDKTNPGSPDTLNYTPTMLMFASLSLLGLIFAIILKREDSKGNYGVELPLNKK
jgi:MFS family permease